MSHCGGFKGIASVVIMSAVILISICADSYAMGLGSTAYCSYGSGEIDKTSKEYFSDNKVEKKGTAKYGLCGIGLVLESNPFNERFSFRMTPGVGFGRISKKYTRKEYNDETKTIISTDKVTQKYNVFDVNLTAKFSFKVLMRDNFNIWVGPMARIGKCRDNSKDYNDYMFGGGVTAGTNIRMTEMVYLTASPSACILYSGNSKVDLLYADCRIDIGVMTIL